MSASQQRTMSHAGANGGNTAVLFLVSSLEKLASSKESKRLPKLKEASTVALNKLKALMDESGSENQSKLQNVLTTQVMRDMFEPFQLACTSNSAGVIAISLDCISKLFSYDALVDGTPKELDDFEESQPNLVAQQEPMSRLNAEGRPLIEVAVDLVCECNSGEHTDEKVHLQVVKALMAAVSSSTVPIHGNVLLKAIRTTWNIFLVSKSLQIQTVAEGSLTQMLSIVFSRAVRAAQDKKSGSFPDSSSQLFRSQSFNQMSSLSPPLKEASRLPSTPNQDRIPSSPDPAAITTPLPDAAAVETPLPGAAADSPLPESQPPSYEGSSSPLDMEQSALDLKRASEIPLPSSPLPPIRVSLTDNIDDLGATHDTPAQSSGNQRNSVMFFRDADTPSPLELFTRDAYLVMRALCKLSTKGVSETAASDIRSTSINSRVLALQLILLCLKSYEQVLHRQCYLPGVDRSSTVLDSIRGYLGLAVGRALASPAPAIYKAALDVFVIIMIKFRQYLKKEVEIFTTEIILNILEMKTATNVQKAAILQALKQVFGKDPCILIEVYINYDCNPEALDNVYERLMQAAAKLVAAPILPGETLQEHANNSDLHYAALEALCASLKSLADWIAINRRITSPEAPAADHIAASPQVGAANEVDDYLDNPEMLESHKQKKTILGEAIRQFNKKPKKGVAFMQQHGGLGTEPADIALWLLNTDGLNKQAIGDYMGEVYAENIAIMHAFLDSLDFTDMSFIDALRFCLQQFRLPGESQKIDRYMLKFAEVYYKNNRNTASNVFETPDAAYTLAYSIMMLNTDLYNPQVKKRMTKAEFVRNNRGTSNKDLPDEYFHEIYDHIAHHEIKLKDDPIASAVNKVATNTSAVAVSRRARKEAFASALEEIAVKVESLFDKKRKKSPKWITATHSEHVHNMFDKVWGAVIVGLSTCLQQSEDQHIVSTVLEAFKNCIVISCVFDLELERNAFVTTLSNFTLLGNAYEMKDKNFAAIKTLLEVANLQGNALKKSWHDVLKCISQLERFQVIGSERSELQGSLHQESTSQAIVIATDRIFSGSARLHGSGIVDFVDALCTVSRDEIPRMYSLTKVVEISYYNMNRIRVEWINIWNVLGPHFIRVGCHLNDQVAYFAVDSLRQLSMKFLEKEELSNFKFQREFLRPFEHVVMNQSSVQVRELVIRCLQQMVQARAKALRSGWKAILAVFTDIAARETAVSLFAFSFDSAKLIINSHLGAVRESGYFVDAMQTLVSYCRARPSQKVSLQAVELIQKSILFLSELSDVDENEWFGVLHAFYVAIVECELEVRTRALHHLFSGIRQYGQRFTREFWKRINEEILAQLFVTVTHPQSSPPTEEMSIWLSTTLIKVLPEYINLFRDYYDHLDSELPNILQVLKACILQENDTLSRLGTSCLQQFMENNCGIFTDGQWDLICETWRELFRDTIAHGLMDTIEPNSAEQQVRFRKIIVKCVLQLLLIQTILEVTSRHDVYKSLKSSHLFVLMASLEKSHQFAQDFNGNLDVRTQLWQSRFTQQLPNLLKQETSSATCLLQLLFQMYADQSEDRAKVVEEVEHKLIPLAVRILESYRDMDEVSRERNAKAWRPVLLTILNGLVLFEDASFRKHIRRFYRLTIDLLMYEVSEDLRTSLHEVLMRTEQFIMQ